jgi:(p)ppGpp synthase/HD superfamily hydrolase
MLQEEFKLAFEAHEGEFRSGSEIPYVSHCYEVAALLRRWGVTDTITLSVSPLHDVEESKPGIYTARLKTILGDTGMLVLNEITFIPDLSSDKSVPQQKAEYIASFATKSVRAIVIKMADRIRNTYDFRYVKETSNYALKYWYKADSLFVAFKNRREEIIEMFGSWTYERIEYDRRECEEALIA